MSHGGTKEFCSYGCSNSFKWKTRDRKPGKRKKIACSQCGKTFEMLESTWVYNQSKFCSPQCVGESKKIRDGMTKSERHRRKLGKPKMYSEEWLEKIRATTRDAMSKPEVQEKLRRPKGPMSLEARIKHSNALAGKMPKNLGFGYANSHYPNVQRGDYENSKGTMYFRSKWEANYALYLDFLVERGEIKSWEYEIDVFIFEEIKFGTRSYRPDFKVFTNDGDFEYHEVKGYMDSKSKTKLKRMSKYYPEAKVILIDSVFYRDLKKKLGKMIGFYE